MSLAQESQTERPSSLHPLTAIWTIARKDWLIEGRARDVLTATLFFAGMVVVIQVFSFGPSNASSSEFAKVLKQAAPGVLWVESPSPAFWLRTVPSPPKPKMGRSRRCWPTRFRPNSCTSVNCSPTWA